KPIAIDPPLICSGFRKRAKSDANKAVNPIIPCCIPIQSNRADPPTCTPSGMYVQKLPSVKEGVKKDTTIAAIKNIKKMGNDHFCNLSSCLMPNQFKGITIDPKITIK